VTVGESRAEIILKKAMNPAARRLQFPLYVLAPPKSAANEKRLPALRSMVVGIYP